MSFSIIKRTAFFPIGISWLIWKDNFRHKMKLICWRPLKLQTAISAGCISITLLTFKQVKVLRCNIKLNGKHCYDLKWLLCQVTVMSSNDQDFQTGVEYLQRVLSCFYEVKRTCLGRVIRSYKTTDYINIGPALMS